MNTKTTLGRKTSSKMIIGLLVLLSFQVITFSFAEQQKEAPSSPSTQNVPSQSFTFTIDQTTEGDFIVPTNGRDPRYQIPSYTYGVPYSWEIYVDNVLRGTFTGSSSGFYTAGPVLTGISTGIHTITLIPTSEDWGRLRAFATSYTTANNPYDALPHVSAEKIIGIGTDSVPVALPYKGIALSATKNEYAGYQMFRNCNHLTSISGTILSITDDKEWSAVTTVGNFFFAETFADTPLMTLPAGSFNISNITTVQNYFFDMTFKNTRIMTLPIGSFATSNISGAVGNYFFSHTFRNTWLIGLPAGSFDISKITEVGGYFFSSTFRKTQLIDLPTGSFTNTLLTKSKLEKPGVFERTFYSTKLDIDVSTREPFASIEPSSPKDTFYNTNAYVQPTAGWTTKQIAQRNVLVRDTTAPTAIISYSPNTGTRTSGNVEVLLQFNKIISPIYGRTATGTNAYIKSYSKNIDEPVDFYDGAGNTGAIMIIISHIDTTPPSIHTPTQDSLGTGSKKLTIVATDTGAGLHPEAYSFDDGLTRQAEATKTFTTDTTGIIKVRDTLGNVNSTGYTISFVTPTPPPSNNPPPPSNNLPIIKQGGGGGVVLKKDSCPHGDFSSSYYDKTCGTIPLSEEEHSKDTGDGKEELEANDQGISQSGITLMQIPPKSSSNALLTRAEMAKMLVVLLSPFRKGNSDTVAEKSTTIQCSHFSDLHQAHEKFQSSIIKVCQWGLMGYYSDGVTIKPAFNPNAFVTLAEIATTFSRLFRGNMYQGSEQWRYHNHLLALQKIGIIPQNIDPMKTEQRKNILKMLSPIPSLL